MMKQELIAKKALYEAKKVELSLETHEEEICKEVNDFRIQKEQEIVDFEASTRAKYAAQKVADEQKVDNYLELLDELITEATQQELQETQEQTQDEISSNS